MMETMDIFIKKQGSHFTEFKSDDKMKTRNM